MQCSRQTQSIYEVLSCLKICLGLNCGQKYNNTWMNSYRVPRVLIHLSCTQMILLLSKKKTIVEARNFWDPCPQNPPPWHGSHDAWEFVRLGREQGFGLVIATSNPYPCSWYPSLPQLLHPSIGNCSLDPSRSRPGIRDGYQSRDQFPLLVRWGRFCQRTQICPKFLTFCFQ